MMLHDYKYSRPSHTISPTPILTALAGTQVFLVNKFNVNYSTNWHQHDLDISPELTKHRLNDAHEFFLGLVSRLLDNVEDGYITDCTLVAFVLVFLLVCRVWQYFESMLYANVTSKSNFLYYS